MPDLTQFQITRAANKPLTVPTWDVSFRIVHSHTGAVLADFTGANTISFPQVLGQLTTQQQDDFVALSMMWLIGKKSGLW